MIDPKYRSGRICPQCEIPTEREPSKKHKGRMSVLRCPRCNAMVLTHDPVLSVVGRFGRGNGVARSHGMGWAAPAHVRELRREIHLMMSEISDDNRRCYELIRRLMRIPKGQEIHIGWFTEAELNELADLLGARSAEAWRPYLPIPYQAKGKRRGRRS